MHPGGKSRNRSRRQEGPAGVQNVLCAAGSPPGTFPVIDPHSKKLFIPLESMIDTRAMHREGVPSLCRIYIQGRCRQGNNCFQAHANTDTVLRLRAAALAQPSCCPSHGAPSNTMGLPQGLLITIRNDEGQTMARLVLPQLCVTNGLHTLVVAQSVAASPAAPEVVVPTSQLCRLHAGHGGSQCCRFGDACSFIHVCRVVSTELDGKDSAEGLAVCPPPNVVPPMPETAIPPPPPLEMGMQLPPRQVIHRMGMSITVPVPMSASVGYAGTPPLNFDPLALAATAPLHGENIITYSLGMSPVRSFSSTPNGLVWRHNPYGSSKTSSVIET